MNIKPQSLVAWIIKICFYHIFHQNRVATSTAHNLNVFWDIDINLFAPDALKDFLAYEKQNLMPILNPKFIIFFPEPWNGPISVLRHRNFFKLCQSVWNPLRKVTVKFKENCRSRFWVIARSESGKKSAGLKKQEKSGKNLSLCLGSYLHFYTCDLLQTCTDNVVMCVLWPY